CSAILNSSIKIQYKAQNTGTVAASCGLTDVNSGNTTYFSSPAGSITLVANGGIQDAGSTTVPCSTANSTNEPNTATLTCQCGGATPAPIVTDSDTASFVCTAVCGDGQANQTCETCDGTDFKNPPSVHGTCRPGNNDACPVANNGCTYCGDGIVQ